MLSMLLLLAIAPQAEAPLPPPPGRQGMPMLSDGGLPCETRATRAADLSVTGDLMWRERGQAVGLYRLLDRRVNGCPAPIIVNYRVPGSDALGREMGRERPIPRP